MRSQIFNEISLIANLMATVHEQGKNEHRIEIFFSDKEGNFKSQFELITAKMLDLIKATHPYDLFLEVDTCHTCIQRYKNREFDNCFLCGWKLIDDSAEESQNSKTLAKAGITDW